MDGWEFFKRTSTLVGLCSAVGGASFFFFTQNHRLTMLEAQILTITTTSQSSAGELGGSSRSNPIAAVCADLARSMVENAKKNGGFVLPLDPNEEAMAQLNCKAVLTK